jgi:uncharacterized protein
MSQDPAAEPDPTTAPVPREARIDAIDYVRGLAVLGILLVNMPLYAAPMAAYFNAEAIGLFPGTADVAALWFIRVVAESKFYTLFSFLFGLGFGVQLVRATRRGAPAFGRFYSRRLFVLLGLGTIHLLFFWLGDVLHVYAVIGYLLLLFRNRSQKALLRVALGLMLVPLVGGTVFLGVKAFRETPAKRVERLRERQVRLDTERARVPEVIRGYQQGTRREVQDLRTWQDVERLPGDLGWGVFEVLAMFLLGLYVARSGFLDDLPAQVPLLRRLLPWGMAGVAGTLLFAVWRYRAGPDASIFVVIPHGILSHVVIRPLHALFYAVGLLLLLQSEAWRRRLAPLAAVGRMALTNYLMHTIICVTLFNGVGFGLGGFGLYGRVGHAAGLALTFAIWAFQLVLSPWWLARYRFGPFEWVWRSLTYGHAQPMRVERAEPSAAAA